ncbi:MAG: methionyl-tRNA formyltransferase [Desulfobacterales bacterium]|nr:methionyl-tRNA formyltransferase [Desulfobacterales bacterium]
MKHYRLMFMGTPGFAVPGLKTLASSDHEVAAVVTQPDRPKGRGRELTPPPVKTTALALGYPVVQPQNYDDPVFTAAVRQHSPDWFIVIAFGHILKKRHLDMPRLGALNVHASLLPKYRGPAPIQWSIIKGELETGVTTMIMDEGLDSGDMLLKSRTAIQPQDTAASLHDRLAAMGAELLVETLDALAADRIQPEPQDHAAATYAPMLRKSDGRIRWSQTSREIDALVRGVTPWPGAHTFFGDQHLKIFQIKPSRAPQPAEPGTVLAGFHNELRIATGDGAVTIDEIQGPGGRRMPTAEFLRGRSIPPGARLE